MQLIRKNTQKISLISVIMPVYNEERYLDNSIKSILKQTYQNLELLIINDNSNDNTLKVAQKYTSDPRVRIFTVKKKIGIAKCLNFGIKKSNGFYIARMDADDWSYEDRFEKQVNFLEQNPQIGVLGGAIEVMDESLSNIHFKRDYFQEDSNLKDLIFRQSPFAHPCLIFRREVVADNIYNEKFSPTEDYDLYFRIGNDYKFANLKDIILKYRLSSTQASNLEAKRQQLLTLYIRLKALVEYGYKPKPSDVIYSFLQLMSILFLPQKLKFFLFNLIRKK